MLKRSVSPLSALALTLALAAPSFGQTRLETAANEALGLTASQVFELRVLGELGQPVFVSIELEGQVTGLELFPHSVVTPDFQLLAAQDDGTLLRVDPGPARTLRGTVVGDPESTVAASLLDDGLYAGIRTGHELQYWLQPLMAHVPGAGPDHYILYADSAIIPSDGQCGSDLLPNNLPQIVDDTQFLGSGGLQIAELGIDADFEYYQDHGSSTTNVNNQIQSVINAMNNQYENEVDIRHDITTIIVRTTSNDPYTTSDAGNLLGQFRSEWTGPQSGIQRDVAQLFTGKNLSGGTIGIAWLGSICNFQFQYSVVESDFSGSFACKTDLSAHEFGHSWNAGHCSCSNNTMNPFITCANTFHPTATRPEIESFRNQVNCLDDGGGGGTVLFQDGFESGNFTAGGWVLQNNKPRIKPRAARTGAFGARIRNTSWIEKSVSTAGFPTITLDYSRRTRNLDAGESLFIEWWNGSSWIVVEQVGDTSNQWTDQVTALPAGAGNNPSFKIRFRTTANQGKERGDVDDISVIGN